jgi:predicted Zn-dependent protease
VLLAQNKVDEALTHLQEAVKLDPSNPRSLLGLAEAQAARGSYDVAIATLERALKQSLTEDLAKEILARRSAYLTQKKPS